MRPVPVGLGVLVGVLLTPALALAAWTAAGSGDAATKAFAMPTGDVPAVSVTGRNVSLTWSAGSFPNGDPVAGYLVRRYPAGGGPAETVLPGCAGVQASTSCVENAVPAGDWRYTITPVHGGWTGNESAPSAVASVGPPSLTLTPATVTSLPASLSGSLAGFATGETVTFRLDDPDNGTVLSGSISPDPIPTDGQASVSVTLPSGTSPGMHDVYAVGSGGTVASDVVEVAVDVVPPTIAAAAIQKQQGGAAGYVRAGGGYRVYASVQDPAPYASGVASVTADVSSLTTGQTAVPLTSTGGPWVVDGTSYEYRSALLTADAGLPEGSRTFSIAATDVAGNGATQGGFSVSVDNTRPSGSDVQTANASGGTAGRAETGDTITFTFSEPIEPGSVLAGWDGTATTVTVRLVHNGGGDRIQVRNAANTTLPFGTVNLGRTDYTSTTRSFTGSTMVMSGSTITITLGTPSGAVTTAAGAGTIAWTPVATPYDRAGNALLPTAVTESGPADPEF